jgi:hypothetical protein
MSTTEKIVLGAAALGAIYFLIIRPRSMASQALTATTRASMAPPPLGYGAPTTPTAAPSTGNAIYNKLASSAGRVLDRAIDKYL